MCVCERERVKHACGQLHLVTGHAKGNVNSVFVGLQVVKVADFGVARVKSQSGVMTAETGTYRWMAPEVCDIFCFLRKCV